MTLSAPRVHLTDPRLAFRRSAAPAPARERRWTLAVATASGVALGALLAYLLDPDRGRRRRHTARDRSRSQLRWSERRAAVRARRAESRAVGIVRRTWNARPRSSEPIDDAALAHKVESELFRRARVPKGRIDINAEDGLVFLRGVVERDEEIARIEAVTRGISGVRAVENLLHMPDTPAPASRPRLVREQART